MKEKTNKKTNQKSKTVSIYKKNKSNSLIKEKTVKYSAGNIGKIEIVNDFLPKPEELIMRDSTIKVTLNLSQSSVTFFKELAEKYGSQYQKIIRIILDSYTSKYVK